MKFVLVFCGIMGCFHYAWFPNKADCEKVAAERKAELPTASYICEEGSPSILERIFQ